MPTELAHSFDIVIILGNLLENAIDASKQTDEKVLNVYISFKQGVLKIEIENSFLEKLLLQEKNELGEVFFATTKRNKMQYGIGISSVKKIVEKYNGNMEIKHRNQRFFVKIILYLSSIVGKNNL